MSKTTLCLRFPAQAGGSTPTTQQRRLSNQRLDDLTAEIAATLARLGALYALRAGGVYWGQNGAPEMVYCLRCGENPVLDPDVDSYCPDCLPLPLP
jgi:hypothetical protein